MTLPVETIIEISTYLNIDDRIALAKALRCPVHFFVRKLIREPKLDSLIKRHFWDQSEYLLGNTIFVNPYVIVKQSNETIVDGIEHVFTSIGDGIWLHDEYDYEEGKSKYLFYSQNNPKSKAIQGRMEDTKSKAWDAFLKCNEAVK